MSQIPMKTERSHLDALLDKLITDAFPNRNGSSLDELKRRRIIDGALCSTGMESRKRIAYFTRRPPLRAAACVFASTAALVATWLLVFASDKPSPGSSAPPNLSEAQTSPTPIVPARTETADSSHVHMELASGIEAVISQDTRFSVDRTRLTRIALHISTGDIWVSKAPETKQTLLEIETPKGTVTVTGTVFSVHVDNRSLRVTVERGVVRVVESAGPVHTVRAGYTMTVDEERATVGPTPDPRRTRAEFAQLGVLDNDEVGMPEPLRERPLSAAPEDEHRVSSLEPEAKRASAKDLLQEINLLRQQRDWPQTAIIYRRLIRLHRKGAQAGPAMLSLGNLLIEKLDDPKEALHWFDAYLTSQRGDLVPEALFGKAEALRRLGNRRAELAVLHDIIKRYPRSLYANRAAERLGEHAQQ